MAHRSYTAPIASKTKLAQWAKAASGHLLLFPALLFVVVVIFSCLQISGSSVGIFGTLANGRGHDPNVLFGHPRAIRSDEATIATPATIAQVRNHFKRFNNLVGQGQDMSVILDVPYLEWSTLLRPQNWSFFVLPLATAFAFKWWLLGWGLIVSCYLFLYTLLPRQKLFNALISLSLFFAPLVQWWYQTITIAPLIYCFLLLAILITLTRATRPRTRIALGIALTYVLACFALILYPPFQVPCALGVVAFYIGYLLETSGSARSKLSRLRIPIVAGLCAGLIVAVFLVTRIPTIKAILDTVYPGHRVVASGHFSLTHFFSGPFLGSLQKGQLAKYYDENQSEASNVIMLWPMLLLPSLYLIYQKCRHRGPLPYALITVNAALLVLAARLFLPLPAILTKLLLLNSIPHNRLLIGFGFLGVCQLALIVKSAQEKALPSWVMWFTAGLTFVVLGLAGIHLKEHFPGFLPRYRLILLPVLACALAVLGSLSKRPAFGAALLLTLSLATTFYVNPLYRGLGPMANDSVSQALRALPTAHDGSTWVFVNSGSYVNFLIAQGIPSYSATYSYPQLKLWHRYDPSGRYSFDYNRYANVFFATAPSPDTFSPTGADSFAVNYNPCDPKFSNIAHVVSLAPITLGCLKPVASLQDPLERFYVYDVTPH